MASIEFANAIILCSMLASLAAYGWLSRQEGTYINVLSSLYLFQIPANYLFPLAYIRFFSAEYSAYAYVYVYASMALGNWSFVLTYTRKPSKYSPPSCVYSYRNFSTLSWVCLILAYVVYAPILFEFREFLLDPRQIYMLTRTGYGQESFVSGSLAYLAIIFILFTKRSWYLKGFILLAAGVIVSLHGSKGQLLSIFLILLLFQVYVRGRRIAILPALLCSLAVTIMVLLLFAATLPLGNDVADALQEISQYSDYTRNAMLVIDSNFPLQYGRLTAEANIYAVIPRVIMPGKPKNFGGFRLAEEFYPAWFDADTGSPDFGMGVQYADFGKLTVIYVVLLATLTGWLARRFVSQLRLTQHPSDFILVVFLAGVPLIPVGGAAWLFPEMIVLAGLTRYVTRIGADKGVRLVRADQQTVGGLNA
jgi:hypothetical protein